MTRARTDSLALSRLLNACEQTIVAQCHTPRAEIPPELEHPLWALSAAITKCRPDWPARLLNEVKKGVG